MNSAKTTIDLQPWLLQRGPDSESEFALWKLETEDDALILFSSENLADAYALAILNGRPANEHWYAYLHPPIDLVRILIACYQSGIKHAVLDPSTTIARRLFSVKDILLDLKESRLKAMRP